MLELRRQGWSYSALSEKYSCPRLTIRYLAKKNGLGRESVVTVITRQQAYPRTQVLLMDQERVNPGKTYAEYLEMERQRRWKRLTQQ